MAGGGQAATADLESELAGLRFDIEQDTHSSLQQQASSHPPTHHPHSGGGRGHGGRGAGGRGGGGSKNVVCIHYLVGMCALDKDCPYLHSYDESKIPVCP